MSFSPVCVLLLGFLSVFSAFTFNPSIPPPASRDPLAWPFASYSIWNVPIGRSAVYTSVNLLNGLTPQSQFSQDDDLLFLDNTQPLTPVYKVANPWGRNRCYPDTPNVLLFNVPFPPSFQVGSPDDVNGNYGAAFLLQDGHTILHTQPITHCAGAGVTSSDALPNVDIFTDGITGSHGGSGLSSIGGTIRLGEFLPDASGVVHPVRHALKTNIWAYKNLYPGPGDWTKCYRWPATNCDGYFNSQQGGYCGPYGGTNPALMMGALLAIPQSINISNLGLQSAPGLAVAWTMQNYGVYVVDDLCKSGILIDTEWSPQGRYTDQWQAAYGWQFNLFITDPAWSSPFTRDMWIVYSKLAVVDNWNLAQYNQVKASNGAMGAGGGQPLQPWAPPFNGQPTPAPPQPVPTAVQPQPTPVAAPTLQPGPSPTSASCAASLSSISASFNAGTSQGYLLAQFNYDLVNNGMNYPGVRIVAGSSTVSGNTLVISLTYTTSTALSAADFTSMQSAFLGQLNWNAESNSAPCCAMSPALAAPCSLSWNWLESGAPTPPPTPPPTTAPPTLAPTTSPTTPPTTPPTPPPTTASPTDAPTTTAPTSAPTLSPTPPTALPTQSAAASTLAAISESFNDGTQAGGWLINQFNYDLVNGGLDYPYVTVLSASSTVTNDVLVITMNIRSSRLLSQADQTAMENAWVGQLNWNYQSEGICCNMQELAHYGDVVGWTWVLSKKRSEVYNYQVTKSYQAPLAPILAGTIGGVFVVLLLFVAVIAFVIYKKRKQSVLEPELVDLSYESL